MAPGVLQFYHLLLTRCRISWCSTLIWADSFLFMSYMMGGGGQGRLFKEIWYANFFKRPWRNSSQPGLAMLSIIITTTITMSDTVHVQRESSVGPVTFEPVGKEHSALEWGSKLSHLLQGQKARDNKEGIRHPSHSGHPGMTLTPPSSPHYVPTVPPGN